MLQFIAFISIEKLVGEMSRENASGTWPYSLKNSQQPSDSGHESLQQQIIFCFSIFNIPVSKLLRTNKGERRMSLFLRKQPVEIPSPTEKDWIKKHEEEDLFLKDPDESLPQPLRTINKVLNLLFDRAWEIIESKRPLQEIKQQNLALTIYHPSAELQFLLFSDNRKGKLPGSLREIYLCWALYRTFCLQFIHV
uniref:Uncharacterized protein n=1 Tax=Anolis carolinensis TaxID=28377 RepID=A0A803T1Z7_ANOCA